MEKIELFELENRIPGLKDCISNLPTAQNGRYHLRNGMYYSVDSYETNQGRDRLYESHKLYVDIQIAIEGSEIIKIIDTSKLSVCESYDRLADITFYYNDIDGTDIELNSGEAIMLMPDDAHIPGICTKSSVKERIKKAVIKIPYTISSPIKYFVMDVDGTLTDGKIYIADGGECFKAFNVKDGYAIHDILLPSGIIPVILTSRKSAIVANRAKELGIFKVFQGVTNKRKILQDMIGDLSCVAYIGDDINDLSCMKAIKDSGGIVGCPSDAVDIVRDTANFVSLHEGGNGAVRDFVEWIR